MATHRIPILQGAMPDTSGYVVYEPFSANFGSNNERDPLIARFIDSSSRDGLAGVFGVPQNFDGSTTCNLVILWSSDITTATNVVWDFEYRSHGGNDTESLDQTGTQESALTVTDAAPSAARELLEASIALTDTNFAAGDTVIWELFRDGVASDTMVGDAFLFGLFFEYDDGA